MNAKHKTTEQIDGRIERVKLILKRLRAERRVAVLRERHRKMLAVEHTARPQHISEILPDVMEDIAGRAGLSAHDTEAE